MSVTAPRLIGLAGVSGAGKDAAGAYLAERHGFVRVAVADALKEEMARLFGLSREQLWGAGRNVVCPRLGRTPRELYQRFGQACRDIDPDVWIRLLRCNVAERLGRGERVVCTDVRMPAEMKAVVDLGGYVWKLVRAGAGAPGVLALDVTEAGLVGEPTGIARVIGNDGLLPDLYARIEEALAVS